MSCKATSKELYVGKLNQINFKDLEIGDTIIFRTKYPEICDEEWFDGKIIIVEDESVTVSYLRGYKSDNEDIDMDNAFFKVDLCEKHFNPEEINYNGKFLLIV